MSRGEIGAGRAAPLTRWVSPHRKPTNRHLHPVAIVVNDSVIKSYSPGASFMATTQDVGSWTPGLDPTHN
jgi:hypothetical protein